MNHRDLLAALRQIEPGFRSRPSQERMMEAVSETITIASERPRAALIEAGTGTGKSLGYLVPSVASVLGSSSEVQIVVSTNTIPLQEQLFLKDLPKLQEATDGRLRFALAKGRTNYVCDKKLQSDTNPIAAFINELRELREKNEWDGDRSNLKSSVTDSDWSALTEDSTGCARKKCSCYDKCSFYAAKAKNQSAHVLITNHALLIADLKLGGGVLLPKPQNTIYLIDEAHHLPAAALRALGTEIEPSSALQKYTERMALAAEAISILKPYIYAEDLDHRTPLQASEVVAQSMTSLVNSMQSAVDIKPGERQATHRFPLAGLGPPLITPAVRLRKDLAAQSTALEDLLKGLESATGQGTRSEETEEALSSLRSATNHVKSLLEDLTQLSSVDASNPRAVWASTVLDRKGQPKHTIHSAPLEAGPLLWTHLWSQAKGVVLTSATIRVLASFKNFLKESGLDHHPSTTTHVIESPFDYKRGTLVIPAMRSLPTSTDAHTQEVAERLSMDIHRGSGNLVLFSSRKQMVAVKDLLPDDLRDCVVMPHSGVTRKQAVEQHIQAVESGRTSILFGLDSFAEGLDLPGNHCSFVGIAKIPFSTPDDPPLQARAEWLEAQGKSAFSEIMLPEASLKLIQAVGRLIRREGDKGRIAIYDRRLVTKSYGSDLLRALPPFSLTVEQSRPAHRPQKAPPPSDPPADPAPFAP